MIPDLDNAYDDDIDTSDFEIEEETSRTYRLCDETITGKIDETDAVIQAADKILNTERYDSPIYSWNYGIELKDLIGKDMDYVMVELEYRISDALTTDDRIESITDYTAEKISKRAVHCTFTINTTNGDEIPFEWEVAA
ncbi:DUF2634 domain-containing protein [[Clostridium] polysaccharolyticum]|uniref:DUF2634 domain-containing protein n=1 Tax=[Clostridium] polysaccharolyticum TaxID=29364 RepID=A0A1H9YIU9_9FIRM|nr:DUF2634 domain-containing protein [[Clostridium] polysaccharolyticum]SES68418.1 Protein of unknown function [[Clostridium] polysaccharolyticum]